MTAVFRGGWPGSTNPCSPVWDQDCSQWVGEFHRPVEDHHGRPATRVNLHVKVSPTRSANGVGHLDKRMRLRPA